MLLVTLDAKFDDFSKHTLPPVPRRYRGAPKILKREQGCVVKSSDGILMFVHIPGAQVKLYPQVVSRIRIPGYLENNLTGPGN